MFGEVWNKDWKGDIVSLIKQSPMDLVMISAEGDSFDSWILLLSLYSPSMASLLLSSTQECRETITIIIPVNSIELSQFVNSLGTDLEIEDSQTARLLDVSSKKKNTETISMIQRCEKSPCKGYVTKDRPQYEKAADIIEINYLDEIVGTEDMTEYHIRPEYDNSVDIDETNDLDEIVETEKVTEDRTEYNKAGDIDDINYLNKIVGAKDMDKAFTELFTKTEYVSDVSKTQLDVENGFSYSITNTVSRQLDESISPSNNQGDFIEPNVKDLVNGQSFHDHYSLMTFIHEWSDLHFSPLAVMSNTTNGSGPRASYITLKCPHSYKKKSKSTGKRKMLRIPQVDCPVIVRARKESDGSYVVTKVMTEHRGHEVSKKMYSTYRKPLTSDQEEAVMMFVFQGANISDIQQLLMGLTEKSFSPSKVRTLLLSQIKKRMEVDCKTGEQGIYFKGELIDPRKLDTSIMKLWRYLMNVELKKNI